MKQTLLWALMLSLGIASAFGQQPIKMTFSGSMVPTALAVQPNSITDEELYSGDGSLGSFSVRSLRTDALAPTTSTSCLGADHSNVPVTAGGGAFRFQDGSLLSYVITGGSICIDFTHFTAVLTQTYQITGGTGRFKDAATACAAPGDCTLTMTARVVPVVVGSDGNVKFATLDGEITGTLSKRALSQ